MTEAEANEILARFEARCFSELGRLRKFQCMALIEAYELGLAVGLDQACTCSNPRRAQGEHNLNCGSLSELKQLRRAALLRLQCACGDNDCPRCRQVVALLAYEVPEPCPSCGYTDGTHKYARCDEAK